jgi:hypothetical protein
MTNEKEHEKKEEQEEPEFGSRIAFKESKDTDDD